MMTEKKDRKTKPAEPRSRLGADSCVSDDINADKESRLISRDYESDWDVNYMRETIRK